MKSKILLGLAGFAIICTNAYSAPVKTSTPSSGGSAAEGIYLKAGVGMMRFDKFSSGTNSAYSVKKAPKGSPVGIVGVGYKFSNALRSDVSLQYGSANYKGSYSDDDDKINLKQKIKTLAMLVNCYYDINFNSMIVPYVTVGAGVARNDASDLKSSVAGYTRSGNSRMNFAWNVGAGLKFDITKNYAIDLGYRYLDFGKVSTSKLKGVAARFADPRDKNGGNAKLRAHQATLGLIYTF